MGCVGGGCVLVCAHPEKSMREESGLNFTETCGSLQRDGGESLGTPLSGLKVWNERC